MDCHLNLDTTNKKFNSLNLKMNFWDRDMITCSADNNIVGKQQVGQPGDHLRGHSWGQSWIYYWGLSWGFVVNFWGLNLDGPNIITYMNQLFFSLKL